MLARVDYWYSPSAISVKEGDKLSRSKESGLHSAHGMGLFPTGHSSSTSNPAGIEWQLANILRVALSMMCWVAAGIEIRFLIGCKLEAEGDWLGGNE